VNWYNRVKRFGFWQASLASLLRNLTIHLNIHFWSIQTRIPELDYIPPQEHSRDFVFRSLTANEVLVAAHNPDLGLTQSFVKNAFSRGDICTGALLGETLVAYSWKTFSHAPLTKGLWIRIDQQPQFYGYKAFVLPEYRGRRLSTSVARANDTDLVRAGAQWGVSYIALSNLESRAVNLKTDSRVFRGYAGYWKIGSHYLCFRTKGAKPFIQFEQSRTDFSI